ncbi:MAG: hypothetical protein CV087_23290 [Candidatus Brocadia sp. WS118]|nr:MAG: hypothetical protein CV087_23290 [Candidatus Brocadia sp. WS118]
MTDKLVQIEVSKLVDDLWDARDKDSKKIIEDIQTLKKSLLSDGLINPVVVVKKTDHSGRYSIVAGRLRTRAAKEAGWKQITCRILGTNDPIKIRDLTVEENRARSKYTIDEEIQSIIGQFEIRGFSKEDIKKICKHIHNMKTTKGVPDTFLDAIEKSGKQPNHLYQIMQTVLDIPLEVQKEIKKQELSLRKRILLTHTLLRKHPKRAISLVKKIKGLTNAQAQIVVNQEIRDLETGATFSDGHGSYIFDYTQREKIDGKIRVERPPAQYFLDTMSKSQELLHMMTGHSLTKGEYSYEPHHVDYSERHRINILKDMTKNQILNLENTLEVLKDAISSYLELIDKEVVRK